MRAKIVPFCQLFNPSPLSANARLCARAQTALPNPARGTTNAAQRCIKNDAKSFAFSTFRRTRLARRTLPGNATRSTNAEKRCLKSDDKIKRLPKTRTKIDFTACREFHLIQSREFHLIQNAYRRTQPKAFARHAPRRRCRCPSRSGVLFLDRFLSDFFSDSYSISVRFLFDFL